MVLPQVTLLGTGWGRISDVSLAFLVRPRPLPLLLRAGADAVTAEPTPNHQIRTYLMTVSHVLHRWGQITSPGNKDKQTLGEFHLPEEAGSWICDQSIISSQLTCPPLRHLCVCQVWVWTCVCMFSTFHIAYRFSLRWHWQEECKKVRMSFALNDNKCY